MSKARGLADLGNAYSDGALSNRNLIINGAMQVAQRGTSSTAHGFHTVDRFKASSDGTMVAAVVTQSQDTTGPQGFSNSYKVSVGTPETVTNLDYYYVSHCIEAQNLQHLNFGLSSAQSVTLSFWVMSSVTGTYTLNLYRQDSARCFPKTYTVNSADVWEKKTISIAGDDLGTITNDNGRGIEIYWTLSAGSNYTTGTDGVWADYVGANFSANHTANVIGTASATWQITGVQLEVGDTATPFEHRSYGDELQRCQRYYEKVGNWNSTSQYYAMPAYKARSMAMGYAVQYKVSKRTNPSVTMYDHLGTTSGVITNIGTGADLAIQYGPTGDENGIYRTQHATQPAAGGDTNNAYGVKLTADAEL